MTTNTKWLQPVTVVLFLYFAVHAVIEYLNLSSTYFYASLSFFTASALALSVSMLSPKKVFMISRRSFIFMTVSLLAVLCAISVYSIIYAADIFAEALRYTVLATIFMCSGLYSTHYFKKA